MKKILVTVLLSTFLVNGCAVPNIKATSEDANAIQFSERLVKEMVNKLDKINFSSFGRCHRNRKFS